MKKKILGEYLISLTIIIILYNTGTMLLIKHYNEVETTFIYNNWLITLIKMIFFGGIGAVFGVDRFLTELNREGKWKFKVPRLIIFGIPSLVFSIPRLLVTLIPHSNSFSNVFTTISSIVLGYTLISSPYKKTLIKK